MASTSNNMFFKSAKTINELVMRLGNQTYEEINVIIANAEKPKKMPQTNPFLVQDFVKKSVATNNRKHEIYPTGFWIFQETFLKTNDNFSNPNKIFFRTHRSNRLRDGLLIGIPKNLSGRVVYSEENGQNLEILAVEVHSKNHSFTIVNIYAPHGFNINPIKTFLNSLHTPTFIFGDFNLHHPLWGRNFQSSFSEDFVDWLNNSVFTMLNTSTPTHIINASTYSILNLTLCSASIFNVIDCYVFDCSLESDHIPIVTSWSKLQNAFKYIKTIKWNPIIKKSTEIFHNKNLPTIDTITSQISLAISNHTTSKILESRDYPPWWHAASITSAVSKNMHGKKPEEISRVQIGSIIKNIEVNSNFILKEQKTITGIALAKFPQTPECSSEF
ncbi:hypothetical protein AVEN_126658-1 [Araneus ventricosus]|uniref:Endonuclease/exonuclease/phosphatase domain-containing protein n=1 Tax=Araneus ventricosus TaxID=182803 RepID=A0A4Y2JDT7_ARAVE|nr:hypothetical protein AVEN_126658-1 [Araneus ventricosus]